TAFGALLQPRCRLAERQARDLLELLRQLAADDQLARSPETFHQIGQGLGNAVRRLVDDDRPGDIEGLQRLASRAPRRGKEAGEQEAGRTESGGRDRGGGGARAG